VKGNGTIYYNGGGYTSGTTEKRSILSWRECRGSDPAHPCD
jgi:hypothetical protein